MSEADNSRESAEYERSEQRTPEKIDPPIHKNEIATSNETCKST